MNRALMLLMAALLSQAPAQTAPAAPVEPPATAAPVQRESTLRLPFTAPEGALRLVVAQDLPSGATYVPGSARLDDQLLPDPLVGKSGRLYWPFDAVERGTITYRVAHTASLPALPRPALYAIFEGNHGQLVGGAFDVRDWQAAAVPATNADVENLGAVKLPLDGAVYRTRDKITVVVEGPLDTDVDLRVNGQLVAPAQIGTRIEDATNNRLRLEYYGVQLQPGENIVESGSDRVRVFYAGQAVRVQVTPIELVANGSSPIRLRVRALDQAGITTAQPSITLAANIEPTSPDANPQQSGYQLALVDGEGLLELPAQATPKRLVLDVLVGEATQRLTFDITPDKGEVGLGHASVTFGLNPIGLDHYGASAYYEGMVGAGKLYAAASTAGLPDSTNGELAFPRYGDASSETIVLQGLDPVAFQYEHPDFRAQYRAAPVPITVFGVGENFTALSASTRGDTRASAFAALVPEDRVSGEVVEPDGTTLLRLAKTPVTPDSETLEVITTEPASGKEVSRRTLKRGADYTVDLATGVISLAEPLAPVDANLNDVTLVASYRTGDAMSNRQLAWGAEVRRDDRDFTAAAAVVSLDGKVTTGAKVTYASGNTRATASAALAGGVQVAADVGVKFGVSAATASVRYQQAGYDGLGAFTPGLNVNGTYALQVAGPFGANLSAAYQQTPTGERGASATLGATYRAAPWNFGLGLKVGSGTLAGTNLTGNAGYQSDRFGVDVAHTQALDGSGATTSVAAKYQIAPNLTASVRDDINWQNGQRASFGLESKIGGTNYSVTYELPTASGDGNRARFGADTTLPLGDKFSVGLRGAALYDIEEGRSDFSVSPTLRYTDARFTASLGSDFSVANGALKAVVRSGLTASVNDNFTLGADFLREFSATPGTKFSVSSAYRASQLNGLGYVRYQDGSLAGGGAQLLGEVVTEYHGAAYAVRGGLAAKQNLGDPGSFVVQPNVGATLYVTDLVGLGVGARALYQPSTGAAQYGLSLEGSLRALPGAWITLGYNPFGFEGIGNTFTKQGFYVRLDLLLDDGNRR